MAPINPKKLRTRIISAAILGPAVVGLIYLGGWFFLSLILVCTFLALYEWGDLARRTQTPLIFSVLGILYISISFYCCYLIRAEYGVFPALAFFVMVVASDTGAYFAGKLIGGPKMSDQISPNKTWAGYAGAILAPALISLTGAFSHDGSALFFLLTGAAIGVTGQTGDLLISWFKRHVGVKDTSSLIPGHGGLLDRVDALMLSAPLFLAALEFYRHG